MNLRLGPCKKELANNPNNQKTPEDFFDAQKTQGDYPDNQEPRRPEKTTKNSQVHAHLQFENLLGIAC